MPKLTEKEIARRKKLSIAAKARHAKKKAEKEATREAEDTIVSGSIDTLMEDGEKQATQDLIQQAIANFISAQTDTAKCSRHPDIDVKAGENCKVCIKNTLVFNARTDAAKFVLPCPICDRKTRSEDGGNIQTFYSKRGAYACAMCEIDYTTSGELVKWQSGQSQNAVNKEIDQRLRRAK
jgi:hypothetical protein